jgi:hypothetical protein
MSAVKIETTIQTDGELHLTQLPFHKGDRVEATVSVLQTAAGKEELTEQEKRREEALQRFQARADASKFRSIGPYPSRDELHERH